MRTATPGASTSMGSAAHAVSKIKTRYLIFSPIKSVRATLGLVPEPPLHAVIVGSALCTHSTRSEALHVCSAASVAAAVRNGGGGAAGQGVTMTTVVDGAAAPAGPGLAFAAWEPTIRPLP